MLENSSLQLENLKSVLSAALPLLPCQPLVTKTFLSALSDTNHIIAIYGNCKEPGNNQVKKRFKFWTGFGIFTRLHQGSH